MANLNISVELELINVHRVCVCVFESSTDGTTEENRLALIEDSIAFGIACATGAAFQLLFSLLSVDLVNLSALKQVSAHLYKCDNTDRYNTL